MTISIIIPCRNEKRHIRPFLESVLAQELDAGYELEILVADGMSDDGTRTVLREYIAQSGENRIRLIDNPGRIVSTGLNAAILSACGEIIVRMDAHSTYAKDYVRECVKALHETGADSVGGPWVADGKGVVGQAIATAFHAPFCTGGGKAHDPGYEGEVDTVYLGCWPRSAFDKTGLFDPELVRNQDDEFHFRLRRSGGRVWQSPRIQSSYTPRASLKALFRQYLQYGFWKVAVMRKHAGLAAWRHAVPALFVGSLLMEILLIALSSIAGHPVAAARMAAVMALELILYLSACVIAASTFARTVSLPVLLLLPVVMIVYHVSYGLGFLLGLGSWITRLRRPSTPSRLFTALTR